MRLSFVVLMLVLITAGAARDSVRMPEYMLENASILETDGVSFPSVPGGYAWTHEGQPAPDERLGTKFRYLLRKAYRFWNRHWKAGDPEGTGLRNRPVPHRLLR